MTSAVAQIKEKLSIVEVLSSYIAVNPAGRQFRARCPFHSEKTASFYISPERNSYHCFGCGKGGDIFTFVEDMEGVTFKEALKILAERAGVQLDDYVRTVDDTLVLYNILEESKKYFIKNINEDSKKYILSRGITEKTLNEFGIGFAVNEWRSLVEHLLNIGFKGPDIVRAGMAIETDRGIYDRFRGRIMFPINDTQGRVVGFSGRILPAYDMPGKSGDKPAKYINSPETDLYHKSNTLFGYDKAKNALRTSGYAIVVEGQMDLVLSHQAGFNQTIAVSGTALTNNHLDLIGRFTKKILFSFDGDEAGIKALKRSVEEALSKDFDVRVVSVPAGSDPADIILTNAEDWKKLVNSSTSIIEYLLNHYSKKYNDLREFRNIVDKEVLPYIRSINKSIDRAHFINLVARAVDLSDAVIAKAVQEKILNEQPKVNYELPKKETLSAETILLGIIVLKSENYNVLENISLNELFSKYMDVSVEEWKMSIENIDYGYAGSVAEYLLLQTEDHIKQFVSDTVMKVAEKRVLQALSHLKKQGLGTSEEMQLFTDLTRRVDNIKKDRHNV
ncbi:MAG: DNA primase [Minisyncoccia bacterium]